MDNKIKFVTPFRENHRALWGWLAANPKKEKWDWPGWHTMRKLGIFTPDNACFLCIVFDGNCEHCPLNHCISGSQIYLNWKKSLDIDKRVALAIKIRDAWPDDPISAPISCDPGGVTT